jgi:hypothetical protein
MSNPSQKVLDEGIETKLICQVWFSRYKQEDGIEVTKLMDMQICKTILFAIQKLVLDI